MNFNLPSLTPEKMVQALDSVYTQVLEGLPGQKNIYDLAEDYRSKSSSTENAISKLIAAQVTKATATGAVTGLGGVLTLPVALPADLAGCLGIQLRMIGAIAVLRGYNPSDDQVRTLVYVALTGQAAADILKQAGIKFGTKMSTVLIKKIPFEVIKQINKAVGFRLVTKFGQTGVINLGKGIPFVGGIIGGTVDAVGTSTIGKTAKRVFN